MTATLSILICSINSRQAMLAKLMGILLQQTEGYGDSVQIIADQDDGEAAIGQKRQRLIGKARGDYVCFIDDDDTVSDDYVSSILRALSAGEPDCVGFRAKWHEDGKHTGNALYSLDVPKRAETLIDAAKGVFQVDRFIGHLNPVRRELALAVGFRPWSFGEDADYSIRLRPFLKTQAFIDRVLYFYWLLNRDARAHERVHPQRWADDNIRFESHLNRAEIQPPDTDR